MNGFTNNPPAYVQQAEWNEDQLIEQCQQALSSCNWTVGQCAAEWTERFAAGRTDADFGSLIGLERDQVTKRRLVWERFGDIRDQFPHLRWSHFYVALSWDDAETCLEWANEMEGTVAEMKAWRRSQHGEDLSQPSTAEDSPVIESADPHEAEPDEEPETIPFSFGESTIEVDPVTDTAAVEPADEEELDEEEEDDEEPEAGEEVSPAAVSEPAEKPPSLHPSHVVLELRKALRVVEQTADEDAIEEIADELEFWLRRLRPKRA